MKYVSNINSALLEIQGTTTLTEADLVKTFSESAIWDLSNSLLTGEHYDKQTRKFVSEINSLLEKIETNAKSKTPYSWKSNNLDFLVSSIALFQKQFKDYSNLLDVIENNLFQLLSGIERPPYDNVGFEHFDLTKEFADLLQASPSQKKQISINSIFKINLALAYLDDDIECSKHTLRDLAKSIKFIQNEKQNLAHPVELSALIDKMHFLQFKVQYRDSHNDWDDSQRIKSQAQTSRGVFEEFSKKIILHFGRLDDGVDLWNKQIVDMTNDSIVDYHFEPFHHLRRYYHKKSLEEHTGRKKIADLKRDEKQIDLLLTQLESKEANFTTDPFDECAYRSTFNLIKNLKFDLELKFEEELNYLTIKTNISDYISGKEANSEMNFLSTFFKKLKEHARKPTGFLDYHCFITFIFFLDKMINYFKANPQSALLIEENESDFSKKRKKFFEVIEHVRIIYETSLKLLTRNFNIMFSHRALPIYLNKLDCTIATPNGMTFFLRSSYILPNNFKKIKHQINSWEMLQFAQYNTLKNTFELEIEKYSFKNKFVEFEKKSKEVEFRIVQIVALFVSIATFVLGNVKIFEGRTGLESFALILGIAACFIVFNLVFYIIVSDQFSKIEWKKGHFWIKLVFFLFVPSLFAWGSYKILGRENFNYYQRIDRGNKYFDSVNTSQEKNAILQIEHVDKRVDSIIRLKAFRKK